MAARRVVTGMAAGLVGTAAMPVAGKGLYGAVTGAVSDALTPRPTPVVAGGVRGRSH